MDYGSGALNPELKMDLYSDTPVPALDFEAVTEPEPDELAELRRRRDEVQLEEAAAA
jgi:hypothetical protein